MDQYGGGDVVVMMQEPTTVHEPTIYGTSEIRSETSLAGPCTPPSTKRGPLTWVPPPKKKKKTPNNTLRTEKLKANLWNPCR
jgi:hypothetical protein